MTDSLGSLVENLRPHPSSLRKQVEARHKSAGEFSFYGPAGSDFGQSLCKPRTRDAGHFSPGPARYNYLHMTPELVRHPFASSSAAHASPAALVEETRAEPVLRPARDVERQAGAPPAPGARRRARARARRAVGRPLPTSTGARRRAIAPPRARSRASTSTARSSRTGRARRTSTRPTSRASSPSSSIPGATLASRRRAAPRPAASGAPPRRPRPQVAALLRPAAELVPVDDQGAAPAAQPKPAVSGGSARRAGARDAVVSGWLGDSEARAVGSWCCGSSASPGAVAGRLDRPAQTKHQYHTKMGVGVMFETSGDQGGVPGGRGFVQVWA